MPEHGEKTTIGLISKKGTLHVQHTFFVPFFAVVLHDCNVNFLPETFLWRKCRTCSRSLFSLPLIFSLHWWPLAFLILSPPLQNFHVVLPTKKCVSFVFYLSLQISVALSLVEFRWPDAFSLFLCLSLALYSKFVDMTINLTLQLPLLYKTRVAMRFPAKITSSCIWVAIPVD